MHRIAHLVLRFGADAVAGRLARCPGRGGSAGCRGASTVLRHRPTGRYVGPGLTLVESVKAALVFGDRARAAQFAQRFACEAGGFEPVAAPALVAA